MASPCGSLFSPCWLSPWPWGSTSALRPVLGSEVGWVCILAAFPFALGGFFQYNSMTFEQFILAVIRSELLYPKRLVFKSDHLYAKALDNSTLKEAVKLD